MKIKEVPTKQIPNKRYKIHCCNPGCLNVIVASDSPIPLWLVEEAKKSPCSECVKPLDYLKDLLNENDSSRS